MDNIARKLAAARTRLVLDKPFLGALVLRLPLIEAQGNWCETSATDARSIYYNPEYMAPLSLSQVQFVLAHEALHCGLSHFARREHRDLNRWNLACDYAVNPLLVIDGLELAPGALYDEKYNGMSAEEIYPLIKPDTEETTHDQHLYDNQSDDSAENAEPPPPGQQQQQQQRPERQPQQQPERPQPQHAEQSQQTQQPQAKQPQAQLEQDRQEQRQNAQQPEQQKEQHQQAHQPQQPSNLPQSAEPTNNQQQSDAQSDAQSDGQTDSNIEQSAEQNKADQPPAPLSVQERERLNIQWQQRLAGAAQQAAQAGKMNGSVQRLIQHWLRSTVPWRTLLARFMSGSTRVDYNLLRPTQRRHGDAILPSLYTRQANVIIALDTSGSVEADELTEFIAEVNAIKSLVNARITLLACDSALDPNGPWIAESWEQLVLPEVLIGGGGTDFSPVFDWIHAHHSTADLVVYFTDAIGRFPETRPAMETLWLVKGSGDVPWGQRIQLN